ncbi:MAG: hypothetical protein ABSF91_13140 [Bacteroidota bacterium]|jgi:hypothetical protein
MADEKLQLEHDSKERVAFDLMKHIASIAEKEPSPKDRAYFFKLYRQCYKATRGYELKQILEEEGR